MSDRGISLCGREEGPREVREDLLMYRSFWAGGAGKAYSDKEFGACYLLGISQSWARNGGLGYLPCSCLLPLPSPSGPESGDLAKATTGFWLPARIPPQLPEPLAASTPVAGQVSQRFHGPKKGWWESEEGW